MSSGCLLETGIKLRIIPASIYSRWSDYMSMSATEEYLNLCTLCTCALAGLTVCLWGMEGGSWWTGLHMWGRKLCSKKFAWLSDCVSVRVRVCMCVRTGTHVCSCVSLAMPELQCISLECLSRPTQSISGRSTRTVVVFSFDSRGDNVPRYANEYPII